MAVLFLKQIRIRHTWGRGFSSKGSGFGSAITELNKEMESIFGEPPSASGIDSPAVSEPSPLSSGPSEDQQALSHVDASGQAAMVDVSSKEGSKRIAVASCRVLPGPSEDQQALSHVDASGQAAMVDVSSKEGSKRIAVASCRVLLGQKAFSLVAANQITKGDVLNVAKIAGISGAKQTSSLIPLCHNIGLTHIHVDLTLNEKDSSVEIEGEAATTGKTGVEMEAMTAVAVAGLTVYDMCKAVSKDIQITDICLEHKTAGKSGIWSRNR